MTRIRSVSIVASVIALSALVAGCETNPSMVAKEPDKGDAFATALHKRYVESAELAAGQADWSSVNFFLTRGRAAARGKPLPPQNPSERKLKFDMPEINAGYAQLSAALGTAAPQQAPDACAIAQVSLEHWMEESEEGFRDEHSAYFRKQFEQAVPDCKVRTAAAPPPAAIAVPGPFDVFFDFNSATLNGAARATIDRIVAAARSYGPPSIVLRGHTDRSGSDRYNDALAKRRVEAVSAALAAAGIRTGVVATSFGESRPRVATADGVKQAENRRVEVEFGKK